MRKKSLTIDCVNCKFCSIDDFSRVICNWGEGKPKVMEEAKGKKKLKCKLILNPKDRRRR
jgi:hypothetical protein